MSVGQDGARVPVSVWCATCQDYVEVRGLHYPDPDKRGPFPVHVTPEVLAEHRATHQEQP